MTTTITYDLSTVPLGAEIPTRNFPREARWDGTDPECGQRAIDSCGTEWVCTRSKGHSGTHVSHFESDDFDGSLAVGLAWRDDDEATA